jgi:hypothetical protein
METKKVNFKSLANNSIKSEEFSLSGAIKRVIRQLKNEDVQNYIVSCGLTTELVLEFLKPNVVVTCFTHKHDENGNVVVLKKVKGQYVPKEKYSVWDILGAIAKIGKEYSKK